ncbi:MAG: alpha/beta hydrolase fold-domain-containing protein, partial [Podila humilis]
GNYQLKGEWIEALTDPKKPDTRPRSKTVILYFHGGGHVFLSPASHRNFLSRLARDVGPGTRVFSVDYRMAPEHPFPAAIHDAFAAYLYL